MAILPRAHPRFRVELGASVEVRSQASGGVRLGGEKTTRTSLDVALRDVSAGGLSFFVKGEALEKGCAVTMKVTIAGRTVSLPGVLVWSQAADGGSLAGIRVHTHLTDAMTRSAFTNWLATKR